MRRHSIHQAFILRQRPQGEKNAGLLLMTQDQAQLWVQAFGIRGEKSALKAVCQPFNKIQAYLYHDPAKEMWKLEDAELIKDALDLRSQMQGIYLVAFFSELFERSPLNPGESWYWQLLDEIIQTASLPGLEEHHFRRIFCMGLWKYLSCTGFKEALEVDLAAGRIKGVEPGVIAYLRYIETCNIPRGLTVGFAPDALASLGHVLVGQVENLLGHQLRSFGNPHLMGF